MWQAVGILVIRDRILAIAAAPKLIEARAVAGVKQNPYLQERDTMSKDIVVGIDISGKFMDIHILPEGIAKRFTNDASGISEAV